MQQRVTTRTPYMKASIAALAPLGRADGSQSPRPFRKLSHNECPFPPGPAVIEAIMEAAGNGNCYPDSYAWELALALAERTNVPPRQIVLGAGSDELLNLAGIGALEPGDETVMAVPSFGRYARSTVAAGGKPVRIPVLADGRNDIKGMLAAVTDRTRIFYCATPNNPSGNINTADELRELVGRLPEAVLLVVDEAYFEFARHAGGPDVLSILKSRKGPWIVMRTFSKAYSLAGLRIGYAMCSSEDVASLFARIRTSFNVSSLAQAAALAALSDEARLQRVLDCCAIERDRVIKGCMAMGLDPLPSVANFVAIPVPMSEVTVVQAMKERDILISAWNPSDRPNVIRISMGLAEDTDAVLTALKEILPNEADSVVQPSQD